MKPGDKITLQCDVLGDDGTVPAGTEVTLIHRDTNYECLWEVESVQYGRFTVGARPLGADGDAGG
jgi:hypothetical protein